MSWTLRGQYNLDSGSHEGVSVVAGDVIAVFLKHEGAAASLSCSDTAAGGTNTYTPATKRTNTETGSDLHGQWFYCLSAKASESVEVIVANAGVYPSIHIFVLTPSAAASYDTEGLSSATAQGDASGIGATAAFTIASTDEMVLAGYGNYGGGALTAETINGQAATALYADGAGNGASFYRAFASTFSNGTAAIAMTTGSQYYVLCALALKIGGGGGSSSELTPTVGSELIEGIAPRMDLGIRPLACVRGIP